MFIYGFGAQGKAQGCMVRSTWLIVTGYGLDQGGQNGKLRYHADFGLKKKFMNYVCSSKGRVVPHCIFKDERTMFVVQVWFPTLLPRVDELCP